MPDVEKRDSLLSNTNRPHEICLGTRIFKQTHISFWGEIFPVSWSVLVTTTLSYKQFIQT